MLEEKDLKQIAQKGITKEQIENQLNEFKTGFPFLKLEAAAGIGNGIIAPDAAERQKLVAAWNEYKAAGKRVVKFVPASGAASRMFKNMFAFVDADYDVPTTDFEKKYFDQIENFAFYEALDAVCLKNEGKGIKALMAEGNYKAVAANMLKAEGGSRTLHRQSRAHGAVQGKGSREGRLLCTEIRHQVRYQLL